MKDILFHHFAQVAQGQGQGDMYGISLPIILCDVMAY